MKNYRNVAGFFIPALALIFFNIIMMIQPVNCQDVLGYVKVRGTYGMLNLRVISVVDAISAGQGVVKIQLEDGNTGAADLVATTHPQASSVRIQTPYGTRAWRKDTYYAKCIGEANDDHAYSVAPTSDGGLVVCGVSNSWLVAGGNEFLMFKMDQNGGYNWGKAYGLSATDEGRCIFQNSEGGYFMVGYAYSNPYTSYYAYVYKLDASGNIIWEGGYGNPDGSEFAYDCIETADNYYVMLGISNHFSPDFDLAVRKITPSTGNCPWAWSIGTPANDFAYGIVQRPDGGYVTVGATCTPGPDLNIHYLLLDANGNSETGLTIGDPGSDESALDVTGTTDGGYVMAGYTTGNTAGMKDFYLRKQNAEGTGVWDMTVGSLYDDIARALVETQDHGFAVVGEFSSTVGNGKDLWFVKFDSIGNPLWSWLVAGTNYDVAEDVFRAPDGFFYVAGATNSIGAGGKDFFLLKFAEDGSTCIGYQLGFAENGMQQLVPDNSIHATRMDEFIWHRSDLSQKRLKLRQQRSDPRLQEWPSENRVDVTPTITNICE